MIPTTECVITQGVLNNDTGEIANKDFREIRSYKQLPKGGFRKVYSSYEQALIEVCNSRKDIEIFTHIKDMFTYKRIEVVVSARDISTVLNVATSKVTKIITNMVKCKVLMRVDRGTYRLNPFMYLPYKEKGIELQSEWNNLKLK